MPMATLPFLLPIHRSEEGELFVDTCLTTHAEASIVFGFARSYFMVYAPLPGALVEWLREILPGKTTAELYMAIGCQKHAKTESYREYLHYITRCDEQFIEAPGIRGMVMLVFTLRGWCLRIDEIAICGSLLNFREIPPPARRRCWRC